MALTLPGWLVEAIRYLGYEFPQTNEDVLHEWSDHLTAMESVFQDSTRVLEEAVAHLRSHNEGPGFQGFEEMAQANDGDMATLGRFGEGTGIAATGCDICAAAVVVMKGIVLFQLGLLAPAIAAGPVTFLLKRGVEYAIDKAVEAGINKLMGG